MTTVLGPSSGFFMKKIKSQKILHYKQRTLWTHPRRIRNTVCRTPDELKS